MGLSFPDSLRYLYGLQKHGIKLGLATIETLLSRLGDPQERYPTFHIAGTNGKGSTAAMVASVLVAAGYRTGLYTSPHLVNFRERIRVNGAMIQEEQVSVLVGRLRQEAGASLSPTFFEFNTAMAFQYFAQEQVEVAVVEVGMGGRFDATNVVRPMVTAITTVALDHQEYLGTTVAQIAFEKGGIIKPGIPLVTGRLTGEGLQVIGELAVTRGAPHRRLSEEFQAVREEGREFGYRGRRWAFDGLSIPLLGDHQIDNAACAVAMVEQAAERRIRVSESALRSGLRQVSWEGRLDVVERDPLVVLDGAHNPGAAQVVADYLAAHRHREPTGRVIFVVGMMKDKDLRGFLRIIGPLADEMILTRVELARAATVQELWAALPVDAPAPALARSTAEALEEARRLASPHDLICVTGSLMLVGEVKALLRGCLLSPIVG